MSVTRVARSRYNRLEALRVDWWLLAAALFLLGLGLTMVLSSSGVMAERFYGDKYYFFKRQFFYAIVGLVAMTATALAPRDLIFRFKYPMLVAGLVSLALCVYSPLGVEVNGARRWLSLGFVSVQPMEFAKLALVIYLAWFFSRKQELVRSFSVGIVPPFAVTGIFCVLLLKQPDFGGAATMAMLLFLMCLAGGARFSYLLVSLALAVGGGWLLISQSPYRWQRILAFLDPFKDALDSGYQLVQSLYALGMGHIFGVGLGAGRQKLFFLPEAHTDFIMAVVGEELGFVGVSLVFLGMGFLLWRVFSVAMSKSETRDKFAAYGMALIIASGAALNMAVVLGAAPPKGVPMPFLSYGGSNMVATLCCVGVLLNLSREDDPGGRRWSA